LGRYNQNGIFQVGLDLQLSIILAEIANSVHPSVSSSAFLLREYFSGFLSTSTYNPKGTASHVVEECLHNQSHFHVDSSDFSSTEMLTVLIQLAHHWKIKEFQNLSLDLDLTNHENQELLRSSLDTAQKNLL
jgi:hypothetical protein